MENDILDSLEDLGYTGPLLNDGGLGPAVDQGPRSVEYTQSVAWLVEQLRELCGLEEHVNATTTPDEATEFIMEISGVLRELNCPYKHLYEGPVTERINTRLCAMQLLDYLTSELQATRMVAKKKPSALKTSTPDTDSTSQYETEVAKHLKMMCIALGFPKPPPNITSAMLFNKVEAKVKELITQYPDQIGKPLLKARLSDKQWEQLNKINDTLTREYTTRREMILKRLDVTIQSFMWSDTAKRKENEIAAIYQPIRRLLTAKCDLGIPQILAARDDLTRLNKTSSGDAREKTKCAINKVLIPRVPDRGGRAWELEPPPPEMPSFQKRVDQPQGQRPQSGRGRGRGGDRGGGRGGKVQGGWGDQGQNYGGGWNQGGGGYGGSGGYGRDHYQQGGGGYQGGGGGYQGGGGGYQGGGGGYQGGGGGYQGGGGGYQGGGGGYQGGGGGYQGDRGGYQGDRGGYRGGRGGRGGRGRR